MAGVVTKRERHGALDLWRGLVLLTIFVNHVPGNLIEHLTYRNLGFSDGAEAFVFIAGVSIALVYAPKLTSEGFSAVAWRCLRRSAELYRVHILLTFAVIVVFAVVHVWSGVGDLLEANGLGLVFGETARGIAGVLSMGHQLGYFNILPLYVVLMLWAPVALALARVHPAAALGVSALIYAVARFAGVSLPNWPEPGTWFFNPFAWQLLLTIGIVAGTLWRDRPIPRVRWLMQGSIAILIFAALVETDLLGVSPGLRDAAYGSLDLWKHDLSTLRLLHFLALAYVLSQLPLAGLLGRTRIGQELQLLGRHGLAVFVAGSLLAGAGQAVMIVVGQTHSAGVQVTGVGVTVAGAACLLLLARYREWSKGSGSVSGLWRAWATRRYGAFSASPLSRSASAAG